MGVLAKTDGTDAQNLANFGKNIQSCLFVAKSEEKKRLYSMLTLRRQSAEMLTAEKNRRRNVYPELLASIETIITCPKEENRSSTDRLPASRCSLMVPLDSD